MRYAIAAKKPLKGVVLQVVHVELEEHRINCESDSDTALNVIELESGMVVQKSLMLKQRISRLPTAVGKLKKCLEVQLTMLKEEI